MPTRLYEIVPQTHPELLGAQDACGHGIGGVWFPASPRLQSRPMNTSPGSDSETHVKTISCSPLPSVDKRPVLSRARFPEDIVMDLHSFSNLSRQVTDLDLELAAMITQHDIAVNHWDMRERTILSGSDKTLAVAWQWKGSTTTTSEHLLVCSKSKPFTRVSTTALAPSSICHQASSTSG
jgi:hypothetical protein